MIICKSSDSMRKRASKTINVTLDETPRRPQHHFKTDRERVKFIKQLEALCRSSMEYRDYIKFLRDNMDMNRCSVLKNLVSTKEKQYSIEIHHEPLTLFSIVDVVLTKYEDLGKFIDPFEIAAEVMSLHYEGKVGLIPLSITQHELVHDGQIFIPLTKIYQYPGFVSFCEEYEQWINPNIQDTISYKLEMTQKCGDIQSNCLDPEFVYVNVDGFDFPQVPEEWGEKRKLLGDGDSLDTPDENIPTTFRIGDTI